MHDNRGKPAHIDEFTTLDRRRLVTGLSALGITALAAPTTAPRAWAAPKFNTSPFPLGVSSGDPASDGFVIWTRLAPDPLAPRGGMPAEAVQVDWLVAADEKLARVLRTGKVLATPDAGHAVHVEVEGLEPGRPYWYAFRIAGHQSRTGRAKTLPASGATPASASFAVAGCQRYDDGLFTAWRHIADEELDFVFHYGDYIYEYGNAAARKSERQVARRLPGNQEADAFTLEDYRRRYAAYQLDPDLQAAHAAHAFLPSFDDHEVNNNWAGIDSGQRRFDRARFLLRRAAAFQAWYEAMPLRRTAKPASGSIKAYRRLTLGTLASIDVLDTRQYRSGVVCAGGWKPTCGTDGSPGQQFIGTEQERWVLDGFRSQNTTWTVLAQQVLMMQRTRAGEQGLEFEMDKWDSARQARNRLLSAAEAAHKNLVVLSGDLHQAIAGSLRADYDNAQSKAMGAEFLSTSISSGGDGRDMTNGAQRILNQNPHLSFWSARRGYLVNTVTAKRWEAAFRTLPYVQKSGAPVETKQRFVVEPGHPAPQRA